MIGTLLKRKKGMKKGMKRFVIVGLGNFGACVAEDLHARGHDVIALDVNEEAVDRIAAHVTRAAVGDGRHAETLERLGARDADVGIVSTGDDIAASILATMALRDLGVGGVYVKVISREHARVMARIGVAETIFPERESAQNLSTRLSSSNVFNYVQLGTGFSMQEMAVPPVWEGQTLREIQLRQQFSVSVVAVHDVVHDRMAVPPDPDVHLKSSDTLLIAGRGEDLERLAQGSDRQVANDG